MEYKSHIMRAIKYIEENIKNEISLSNCARVSGYSNYHFIRVFKEATGLTPADYIRKRRLTEIIKHIRPDIPISQIAFEYGFNSKENFTRAFIAEHHILPTEYKSALNSLKLYEEVTFEAEPFLVKPTIMQLEPFVLVVYKSDEAYQPNFWNKYNSRKWSKKLSGGAVCEDYGVCSWNAAAKKMDYYIGIRKENALGDLTDTTELSINGGLYAVFATPKTSHYDFVNTIHRTWSYINCVWLPDSGYNKTGEYEFESYIEESRTFSERIYIKIIENERTD
jgi:AraC family transcriptional regulator